MPSFSFVPSAVFPHKRTWKEVVVVGSTSHGKGKETSHKSLLDSIPHQRRRVGKQVPPSLFLLSLLKRQASEGEEGEEEWSVELLKKSPPPPPPPSPSTPLFRHTPFIEGRGRKGEGRRLKTKKDLLVEKI